MVKSSRAASVPCWRREVFVRNGRRLSPQPPALASALARGHQPPPAFACFPGGALWPLHSHRASRDMSRGRQPAALLSLSCRQRVSEVYAPEAFAGQGGVEGGVSACS